MITIYTAMLCPFCKAAKRLLASKEAAFEEIDVSFNSGLRSEMSDRAGGATSVPQIWIGERHVGGCDELFELDQDGELDPLIEACRA